MGKEIRRILGLTFLLAAGPLIAQERITVNAPPGSGAQWWIDADPDTPGIQRCRRVNPTGSLTCVDLAGNTLIADFAVDIYLYNVPDPDHVDVVLRFDPRYVSFACAQPQGPFAFVGEMICTPSPGELVLVLGRGFVPCPAPVVQSLPVARVFFRGSGSSGFEGQSGIDIVPPAGCDFFAPRCAPSGNSCVFTKSPMCIIPGPIAVSATEGHALVVIDSSQQLSCLNVDTTGEQDIRSLASLSPVRLGEPLGGGRVTLRSAMQVANTNQGANRITFRIPDSGRAGGPPWTININSALPALADVSGGTFIDGGTQEGVVVNRAAGAAYGFSLTSPNNVVRKLAITRFPGAAVRVIGTAAQANRVVGCKIGTTYDGTAAAANGVGVLIDGAPNTIVGGTTDDDRNVISGNTSNGIEINGSGATGNRVQGNYIGLKANGTEKLGNNHNGVRISEAPDNLVGGPSVAQRNIISGNAAGVMLIGSGATGNKIEGNYIGPDQTGVLGISNSLHGVWILDGASGNKIGGDSAEAGNWIAFNALDGVFVESGTRNAIRRNSIFSNGELGIDLAPDKVTPNDAGDGDAGPNNLQNFPDVGSVPLPGGGVTVSGALRSAPGATYEIDFYGNFKCDESGFGEGEEYLGSTTVTTDGRGLGQFSRQLPSSGPYITATATDANGNTSEFSDGAQKIALGGRREAEGDPGCFKIYVPDKWGGKLTVYTSDGQIELFYPDFNTKLRGPAGRIEHEVGQDKHKWYFVKHTGASPYTITNGFEQDGKADKVPWNFYFYPFKPDTRGNLYDPGGAYAKFDKKFRPKTSSFDWESSYHKLVAALGWEGHCWGGAIASIVLEQPGAANDFTEDELEGLGAEFFDNTELRGARPLEVGPRDLTGKPLWWPFVKPEAADTDDSDKYPDNFHNRLREYVRMMKVPILMDLRQRTGAGAEQVWNQGIYKYTSGMEEDPAAVGDELTEKVRQIKITTLFTANDDFGPVTAKDPETGGKKRVQKAIYILIYNDLGEIAPNAFSPKKQNWISMTLIESADAAPGTDLFIPSCIFDVTPVADNFTGKAEPAGRNPEVTSKRLKDIGLRKRF